MFVRFVCFLMNMSGIERMQVDATFVGMSHLSFFFPNEQVYEKMVGSKDTCNIRHKAQNEDNQLEKLKKMSNTDPTKNGEEVSYVRTVSSFSFV